MTRADDISSSPTDPSASRGQAQNHPNLDVDLKAHLLDGQHGSRIDTDANQPDRVVYLSIPPIRMAWITN